MSPLGGRLALAATAKHPGIKRTRALTLQSPSAATHVPKCGRGCDVLDDVVADDVEKRDDPSRSTTTTTTAARHARRRSLDANFTMDGVASLAATTAAAAADVLSPKRAAHARCASGPLSARGLGSAEDALLRGRDGIAYIDGTKMPRDGWYQRCFGCGSWTAQSVVLGDFEVFRCAACAKEFRRRSRASAAADDADDGVAARRRSSDATSTTSTTSSDAEDDETTASSSSPNLIPNNPDPRARTARKIAIRRRRRRSVGEAAAAELPAVDARTLTTLVSKLRRFLIEARPKNGVECSMTRRTHASGMLPTSPRPAASS
jgi:hypothetical protein